MKLVSKLACGNFKICPLVLIVLGGSWEVMGSRRGNQRQGVVKCYPCVNLVSNDKVFL